MRITVQIDGITVFEQDVPQAAAPAAASAGAIDGGPGPVTGSVAGLPPVAGIATVSDTQPAPAPATGPGALSAGPAPVPSAGPAPVGD